MRLKLILLILTAIAFAATAPARAESRIKDLTDIEGVKDEKGKLVSELQEPQAVKMIEKGVVKGGMIPKVKCCIQALTGGVHSAHIIDGRVEHAVLLEVFTDKGVGTIITE